MTNLSTTRPSFSLRRLWLAEVLIVAGVLVFGGFVLVSEAHLTPAQIADGLSQVLAP